MIVRIAHLHVAHQVRDRLTGGGLQNPLAVIVHETVAMDPNSAYERHWKDSKESAGLNPDIRNMGLEVGR